MLAGEAASLLGLERVLLVPAGEPPHRRIVPEPGRATRLEMTRLAAAGNALLEASEIETAREGPSYSFETLELLAAERPGDELWFLMGADVAAALDSWRRPERVLELARVAVAGRPGTVLDEAETTLERLGAAGRMAQVGMPELGVSSTLVRRRVAAARPIRYLVPDGVLELIEADGLYRD